MSLYGLIMTSHWGSRELMKHKCLFWGKLKQTLFDHELILCRKKFHFSDQNVDRNDPVQLNLLFHQVYHCYYSDQRYALSLNYPAVDGSYSNYTIPYSWFFLRYVNSTNFADIDHSWNLTPQKTNCPLKCWTFGRPIRENKIAKKTKTSHLRNLSSSKKPTIPYCSMMVAMVTAP